MYSFNSEPASLFHSESQFLVEHLKGGIRREVNAVEACVSPEMGNKITAL